MLDLINSAFAQTTTTTVQAATSSGNVLMQFLPFFLIMAVFYFLLIRPQQKKFDEQAAMISALKKGDRVITSGGIVGVVAKADDKDYIMVEIADNVRVKVQRSSISGLVPPVTGNDNKEAAKKD